MSAPSKARIHVVMLGKFGLSVQSIVRIVLIENPDKR